MPADDSTKRKATAGSFKPSPDSRRHTFTPEECSAGFWAGLVSYVEQGGEARNFLRRKMRARGQTFRVTPKRDRGRHVAA